MRKLYHMRRVMRKPALGFPSRSATNRCIKPQKMDRGLKMQKFRFRKSVLFM